MTTPHTYDPTTHKVVPVGSVVLNPASGVVWEFLNKQGDSETFTCVKAFQLAQEIHKQMPAPRIPEPGWDSKVVAGTRGTAHRRQFLAVGADCWVERDQAEATAPWHWSDLVDPVLIRKGVQP